MPAKVTTCPCFEGRRGKAWKIVFIYVLPKEKEPIPFYIYGLLSNDSLILVTAVKLRGTYWPLLTGVGKNGKDQKTVR